jgi:hypothetical protein
MVDAAGYDLTPELGEVMPMNVMALFAGITGAI